jgi:uncharacterized protein YndB with AHSA1/START domain
MKSIIHVACLSLLCVAPVAAHAAAKDTSYRDAAGNRVQQLQIDIDVPVARVWWALTTSEGFQTWAAPVAEVTLGNDGTIEASYRMTAKIGDPDNIRNRIVAYLPEHLLILKNEHAPKNAPFSVEAFGKVRTIIELQDLGGGRTHVVEISVGYGEGKDFDSVYTHFRSGNAEEFDLLEKSLTKGPIDWKAEFAEATASMQKVPPAK